MNKPINIPTNPEYPSSYVIAVYALLGGPTGGLVIGLLYCIISILNQRDFTLMLQFVIFAIFIGFVVGIIPAMLTGIVLAYNEMTISKVNNFITYLMIALTGFIVTVGYIIVLWIMLSGFPKYTDMSSVAGLMGVFGLIGAFSAIIVGKIVLPKI